MQSFTCPWCGPRSQIEFSYCRAAESVATTPMPEQGSAPQGHTGELERIYLRGNHIGVQEEIWQHTYGCRGWLRITRNNLTHEVRDCAPASLEHRP
jgi:heterotetrameric sarcosine oxidase delta subunit